MGFGFLLFASFMWEGLAKTRTGSRIGFQNRGVNGNLELRSYSTRGCSVLKMHQETSGAGKANSQLVPGMQGQVGCHIQANEENKQNLFGTQHTDHL